MILILGGGLAGLSTAYHLKDDQHLVVEAAAQPGGLCITREIEGFHFDYTGHLLHLRDERAIRLVDTLLPEGALERIERRARVRTRGVTLPFPFQANLHGLPKQDVAKALTDFVGTLGSEVPDDPAISFEQWSLAVFGRGISDLFMFPYNAKLFRRDPAAMTADWVSWAVPKPSLEAIVRGALGIANEGLGYNPAFLYPSAGGIGILPEALASKVPNLRCNAAVERIDLRRRIATLADGDSIAFDRLVVTIPLPRFLQMLEGDDVEAFHGAATQLDWSVVGCVNLGVAREAIAEGTHWLYTPDADVPFYRVGFPTNITAGSGPEGASSMYVEFGLRRDEPRDAAALEQQAIRGLEHLGILRPDDRILAKDTVFIDPGYVIFDRERQRAMDFLVPALEAEGVHLIGRYGAWTYSYMERALLDGMELAPKLEQVRV